MSDTFTEPKDAPRFAYERVRAQAPEVLPPWPDPEPATIEEVGAFFMEADRLETIAGLDYFNLPKFLALVGVAYEAQANRPEELDASKTERALEALEETGYDFADFTVAVFGESGLGGAVKGAAQAVQGVTEVATENPRTAGVIIVGSLVATALGLGAIYMAPKLVEAAKAAGEVK